jgi:hypothetical protein
MGIRGAGQVLGIISFVGARQDEDLAIVLEDRVKTRARLTKEALSTDNPAELFGPGVTCDPPREVSQSNAVTARQEHRPEVGH